MLGWLYGLYSSLLTYIGVKRVPSDISLPEWSEYDAMEKGIYRISEATYEQ